MVGWYTYSCFFYLIGEGNGSGNGWVAAQGISNSGLYEKYVTAFYWAVMTMCGLHQYLIGYPA